MPITFEVEERIDRAPEDVFAYVSDVTNDPEWHPNVSESTKLDDTTGEGMRWRLAYGTPWGTTQLIDECIVYEPPERFGYETLNGVFGGRLRTTEAIFTFEDHDGGTRVTIAGTTQVNGVLRLLSPVFGNMIRSELADQLESLKATLEDRTDEE